jgi:hypothetical protein
MVQGSRAPGIPLEGCLALLVADHQAALPAAAWARASATRSATLSDFTFNQDRYAAALDGVNALLKWTFS